MRICILCPGWPGNVNCFNGIFIKEQATNLSNLGCDVSVVTARVFKEDPPFLQNGKLKVYRFWFPSERKLLVEYERIPVVRIGFYLISGILKTLRAVRKEHCDLIHAHWAIPAGFMAVVAGKILGKPVIITAHDSDITTFPRKSRIAARLIRFSLHRASLIISASQTLRDIIIKNFAIEAEKIRVIPLGIDRKRFEALDKKEARKRLNLPLYDKIILFIGALIEAKGLRHLFKAIPQVVAKHREALFVLIGQGALEAELEADIRNRNLADQVRFVGSKPHTEVLFWMSAADVLLLPSLSEGLPISILEALAVGLPVVASRVGAVSDVIEEGKNGILIEPARPEEIVRALEFVLGDEKRLDHLRKGAFLSSEYSSHFAAEKIKELYQLRLAR